MFSLDIVMPASALCGLAPTYVVPGMLQNNAA